MRGAIRLKQPARLEILYFGSERFNLIAKRSDLP